MTRNDTFVTIDGTELYFEIVGDGPVLVLVQNGYKSLHHWDGYFYSLSDHFTVIRYDFCGFRQSEKGISSHNEDLLELLQYLLIDRACLLGVSLGSSIALDFTLQNPEYVDSLILSAPSVEGYKPTLIEVGESPTVQEKTLEGIDNALELSVNASVVELEGNQSDVKIDDTLMQLFMSVPVQEVFSNSVH